MVQRPREAFSRTGKVVSVGLLLVTVYLAGMIGADKCAVIFERFSEYHWFLR